MCGIAGCFHFYKKVNPNRFEQMVDMVRHRGPDDGGTFYQDGLALGHRRLSIIDPGADGHQPFLYKNRYVVVFNGEIYNYRKLRKQLEHSGVRFETKTDTEVLAAAYDFYGKECLHYFNGMWAFAIFDRKKNELYCSRDRFGVKPFYYYLDHTQFIFASEIKQILCMLEHTPAANVNRLLEFLVCGDQDYTSETMFRDIMQLRGGCELTLDLKKHHVTIGRYYDLNNIQNRNYRYEESCHRFLHVFEHAVRLRMRADVPVGYCLSGGLDSSSIVCMANHWLGQSGQNMKQHAVSSCFEDPAYDEQEYMDEVIRRTGICSHKVYPDANRLFEEVDQIIWHMDEPFGSTSIYAQWNVFKEAKKNGLTVMLDAQGADEQLAGYSAFYGVHFANLLKHCRLFSLIQEIQSYKKLRASTESYVNAKQIIFTAAASILSPVHVHRIAGDSYFESLGLPFTVGQLREVYQNRNIYPMKDARQYILDSMQYGMQSLLHYEDRDSMAFSIESRVPFLDYELVEAIFEMPFRHKIRKGVTKALLRDGLRDILPEKIRTRYSKLGFTTPEDRWIEQNAGQYRRELADACDALAPLLDKQQVMQWFDRKKGKVDRGDFMIWRMICAGRWMNLFHVSV